MELIKRGLSLKPPTYKVTLVLQQQSVVISVVDTKSSCVSVEVRCDVPELENGYYSGYRTGESILLVSTHYYSSVARQLVQSSEFRGYHYPGS